MNAAAKFVLAVVLVGLFLFNPIALCAAPSGGAAHSCCPAPVQKDCGKRHCACAKVPPPPAAVNATHDGQPTALAAAGQQTPQAIACVTRVVIHAQLDVSPPDCRFLRLHQILI